MMKYKASLKAGHESTLSPLSMVYWLAGTGALIALCYFFVDRQLAAQLRPNFYGVPFFAWLTYFAKPLTPIASIIAAAIAAKSLAAGKLSPHDETVLRCALAILIAGVFTYELKEVFGRTWPETWINKNPSYFGEGGVYGFFPFHGGQGWAAFPSGHTTVAAAFGFSLWFLWPALRWLGMAVLVAVGAGLLFANYHWLSDIIAGTFVGGMAAYATARVGNAQRRNLHN